MPDVRDLLTSAVGCLLIAFSLDLQSKKANFDATHELEELLLEDNPLKVRIVFRNPTYSDIICRQNSAKQRSRRISAPSFARWRNSAYSPPILVYDLVLPIVLQVYVL